MPLKASESFYYNPSPAYLLSPCTRTRLGDPSPISLASAVRGPFARAPALALELARAGQLQLQLTHPHSHMHAGAHVHVHTNRHHTHAHARTRTRPIFAHLHAPALALAFARTGQSQLQLTHPHSHMHVGAHVHVHTNRHHRPHHGPARSRGPSNPAARRSCSHSVGRGGAGAIVGRVHTSPSSRQARHDHELDWLKFRKL